MKNGEPVGMINCRITSLEFGGKPTAEATPHTATPPAGKLDLGEDLPF
jgi:hypothetical protein